MTVFSRREALALVSAAGLMTPGLASAAARGPVTARIVETEGRVWVAVTIDKSAPMLFIIDTGAFVSLIREEDAKRLKLKRGGKIRARGIGGVVDTDVYTARNVNIGGGLEVDEVFFSALTANYGKDAAGALAANLMTDMDSDLDFQAGVWRIWPDGRADRTGFQALDSEIDRSGSGAAKIYAKVSVDGVMLDLMCDTGAPGNIALDSAAVRKSGLWNDNKPYSPARLRGLGGSGKPGRWVRAGQVSIGDISFNKPLIFVNDPSDNPTTMRRDGILGLNLLRHMTLSTDIKGKKLWVQRNTQKPIRFPYPLAGVWLEGDDKRIVVADVGKGSPAEAADVRRGDVVVAPDFASGVRAINGEAGKVSLTLVRGGETLTRSYTLASWL